MNKGKNEAKTRRTMGTAFGYMLIAVMSVIFCACESSEDGSLMSYSSNPTTTTEMWDSSIEALSASKKINDTTEEFAPQWVKFENGKEVSRETFHAVCPRVLRALSNWRVEAKTYSQSTEVVELLSQQEKDTTFYANENHMVVFTGKRVVSLWQSTVTVDGSVTEVNRWESIEVDDVTVSYKGKNLALGHDAAAASNESAVDESGKYGDTLTYVFGDNTKTCVAPGQIVLASEPDPDPFFPRSWGRLLAVKQANTKSQASKTSINSWSLHFERGTLPVMVENDSPVWAFEYFEAGQTDSRLNSGCYYNGKVVNTIAEDKSATMAWLLPTGGAIASRDYQGLNAWNSGKGWDDGFKVDNHYSVHNEHHTFTLDNSGKVGVLKIRDARHNKTIGEFTYSLK
jgi:hypothetical protein